jgi:hypothetical protein
MQVAVALAGFTGVMALIDRGAAKVSDDLASFRVRYLVKGTIAVLVFSGLPQLAMLFGWPEREIWRWSCALLATYTTYYVIGIVLLRQTFKGAKAQGMRLTQYYIFMPLGVASILLLLAGVAGYVPADASYAVGVFWFLLGSAFMFARLVSMLDESLRRDRRG